MSKRMLTVLAAAILVVEGIAVANRDALGGEHNVTLSPKFAAYIDSRIAEFGEILPERKSQLEQLAGYMARCRAAGQPARFIFICTHNSRRSQMSQLWAATAAARYGVDAVEVYSGGTECTAFNSRAVAALERAGFELTNRGEANDPGHVGPSTGPQNLNPQYAVVFAANREPLTCFSKVYDSKPNPTADFCAVMVCSHADQQCPVVRGAVQRIALPYDDPKLADSTPQETATYDARCAQIARELLYAFSLAR